MSYIHKFIEDKEIHEPVQWLFRRFVSEYNDQNSVAWNKHVKQNTDEYHRKTLLKQGRCDFDKPPYNLTSAELIVLYNYYYFPMHFQSSYEIYNSIFEQHLDLENKTVFFHDYGCGTLSSTMAFGASFQKYKLSPTENKIKQTNFFESLENEFVYKYNNIDVLSHLYYYTDENNGDVSSSELGQIRNAGSIQYFNLPNLINGFCLNDISVSIKSFLQEFLKENCFAEPYQDYFFNVADCTDSHFYFPNIADKFYVGNFSYDPVQPFKSFCNSQKRATKDHVVIINFSYVLASDSIDIDSINSMINEYLKTGCSLIIVNQNPDLDSLNKKWELLKDKVEYVKSIKSLQPIKHFGSKSKSRFEVIFPTNIKNMFEEFDNLYNENKYNSLDHVLADYFKSNLYNPLLHEIEVNSLDKTKYFNLCNYISDFQYANNLISTSGYYHDKAHLYRDINSIAIAKCFYEKEIIERNGHQCGCYKNFMNKYFPDISNFSIDDDNLPL